MNKVAKKITTAVLLMAMVLSAAACSKIQSKTTEQFKKAVIDSRIGAQTQDFTTENGNGWDYIEFTMNDGSDIVVDSICWVFNDKAEAKSEYDAVYKYYMGLVETGVFSGSRNELDKGDYAYFTIKGTGDGKYIYGGWYYSGNSVVYVCTNKDSDDARTKVNKILDQLGYPKP